MARKADIKDRILDAVLELAPITGWRALSMTELADEAGVPLADVHAAFPTKASILAGLLTRVDRRVLAEGAADANDSPRDRLFDVIMRRFDALGPHRHALSSILRDLPADPLACLDMAPRFATSMAWMLETAGVSSTGLRGAIRVNGLALIYLSTLRVWLSDDSEDKAQTMAALDRSLKQAERRVRDWSALCRCRPARHARSGEPDTPPPMDDAPATI